jgi:hypothetical protein
MFKSFEKHVVLSDNKLHLEGEFKKMNSWSNISMEPYVSQLPTLWPRLPHHEYKTLPHAYKSWLGLGRKYPSLQSL